MKNINLTEWALRHKQLVYYFIVVILLVGSFSYVQLGRMEEPDMVLHTMLVSIEWPGANARQVEEQVTDKIEKKLQDTPKLDYIRSYSRPGHALIYVNLKETVNPKDIRPVWLEVRNMVNDIRHTLPQGIAGPYFNDRFDDVFGNIYALTSDEFTYEEMRKKAEQIRRILLGVQSVKKVDLIGVQTERIFIEIESSKLAQLGIDPNSIISAIQTQDAMAASGSIETSSDNIYLRVTGMFDDIESIRNLPIRANNHTIRLADIAKIQRNYADPIEPKMFYNGQAAVGLAVSMENGGNILNLGRDLNKTIATIKQNLPVGFTISQVSNQPKVVEESIGEFVKTLGEAVIIVLVVCFFSLGIRSGLVVAVGMPLIFAGVFVCMRIADIDLHKISLGSLIIALGLMVDDAIISLEMMSVKMEQGWDRTKAACYAYTATAFPMLTGTLITCAGFIPLGLAKGDSADFTSSIFKVVTIALLISWFVSVLVTPLLGYKLIKSKPGEKDGHAVYDAKFYQLFRQVLTWCLGHRKLVLGITLVCFIGAIGLLQFVREEFFPPSMRPELIVELTLPEGSSLQSTEYEARRFAEYLTDDTNISSYSYYVGQGAPRLVICMEAMPQANNYAQFIIVAKDIKTRAELMQKINKLFAEKFDNVRGHINLIQTGPPADYPVMFRVSGYEHAKVKEISNQVSELMAQNLWLRNINVNWNEKIKVMHLEIDQDKARILGINSQALASALQNQISGAKVAEFRERDQTIGIVYRMDSQNRRDLAHIKDMPIHIGNGQFVPLEQIARIHFEAEEGLIWRRNLKPTVTVQAEVASGITGNDATKQVYKELNDIRNNLPLGYNIDIGGSLERSISSQEYLALPVPIMMLIILTLLMLQFEKMSLVILTILTAPLGIIGVSLSMILTQRPMGFVAQLGILALSGMIIRNSVILVDQIEKHIAAGATPWDAIIDSAVQRFRPIMLTAVTAMLGMIPLVLSNFWGPMAVAIAGGLFGATVLTLLVLPTMYAAWFNVHQNKAVVQDTDHNALVP